MKSEYNKIALFGLYNGQAIVRNDKLELRTLSNLSNGEMREIANKYISISGYNKYNSIGKIDLLYNPIVDNDYSDSSNKVIINMIIINKAFQSEHHSILLSSDFSDSYRYIDLIRSFGICFNFKDISIEEQIKNNWIEIVNKIHE